MTEKQSNQTNTADNLLIPKEGSPSIFARCMDIHCELSESMGLAPAPHWKKRCDTPSWAKNICNRYKRTIFRQVSKLKPNGKVNLQHYGRSIGMMKRFRTYLTKDVPAMLQKDGFEKISKERQAKFDALLGEQEMRRYCLKLLKRPAADSISTEALTELVCAQVLEGIAKHEQIAAFHINNQSAKDNSLFWKGVQEGLSIFIDDDGEFTGDDRRTEVYADLIGLQYEVEKMRKKLPAKSRPDLLKELEKLDDFRSGGKDWFNQVCRDIKLTMRGRGRPHSFAT